MTTKKGRARRLEVIEQVRETWTDELLGIALDAYEGRNRMSSGRLTWKVQRDPLIALVAAGRVAYVLEGITMGLVDTARESGVSWAHIAAALEVPETTLRRRYQEAASAVEVVDAVAPGDNGYFNHEGP